MEEGRRRGWRDTRKEGRGCGQRAGGHQRVRVRRTPPALAPHVYTAALLLGRQAGPAGRLLPQELPEPGLASKPSLACAPPPPSSSAHPWRPPPARSRGARIQTSCRGSTSGRTCPQTPCPGGGRRQRQRRRSASVPPSTRPRRATTSLLSCTTCCSSPGPTCPGTCPGTNPARAEGSGQPPP